MRRADEVAVDGVEEEALQRPLTLQVEAWRPAGDDAVERGEVSAAAKRGGVGGPLAQQRDDVLFALERARRGLAVLQQGKHANDGGGVDGVAEALVVQADIAGDDGRLKRAGRGGHAIYRLGELEVDGWLFGVAEVEAVGEGDGQRAGARDVARGLGDGQGAAV